MIDHCGCGDGVENWRTCRATHSVALGGEGGEGGKKGNTAGKTETKDCLQIQQAIFASRSVSCHAKTVRKRTMIKQARVEGGGNELLAILPRPFRFVLTKRGEGKYANTIPSPMTKDAVTRGQIGFAIELTALPGGPNHNVTSCTHHRIGGRDERETPRKQSAYGNQVRQQVRKRKSGTGLEAFQSWKRGSKK